MFQMGSVGPMLGQGITSVLRGREDSLRHRQYTREGGRIYHILDKRLADNDSCG